MANRRIDMGNSHLQMGASIKGLALALSLLLLFSTALSMVSTHSSYGAAAMSEKAKPKAKPSPSPKFPPAKFKYQDGVYAKVPTSKELVGLISAKRSLAAQVKDCTKLVCGAVQVTSEQGCMWWEINSHVFSNEKVLLGNLRTTGKTTGVREIKTILLVSPEPIETLEFITDIEVVCHQDPKPSEIKRSTYVKVSS